MHRLLALTELLRQPSALDARSRCRSDGGARPLLACATQLALQLRPVREQDRRRVALTPRRPPNPKRSPHAARKTADFALRVQRRQCPRRRVCVRHESGVERSVGVAASDADESRCARRAALANRAAAAAAAVAVAVCDARVVLEGCEKIIKDI